MAAIHFLGPRFCWHCGGPLRLPHFKEVKDQLGHVHRVHGVCLEAAKEEVNKKTAQPAEWPLLQ